MAYRWEPSIKVEGGKGYTVPQVRCDECPVSFITAESRTLIELEAMNQHAHQSTGANLFGLDAGQWPAIWHDLITTIQVQRKLDEAAYNRSISNGR